MRNRLTVRSAHHPCHLSLAALRSADVSAMGSPDGWNDEANSKEASKHVCLNKEGVSERR